MFTTAEITAIFRNLYPQLELDAEAIELIKTYLKDLTKRLLQHANQCAVIRGSRSISARDVRLAARLLSLDGACRSTTCDGFH